MGNQSQNLTTSGQNVSILKEIHVENTNEANIQGLEEYDNPKRNILSSNFLSGQNYSSNNLSKITTKENINFERSSSRRFSLIKIDSIEVDNDFQPSIDYDDLIKQSSRFPKKQRTISINNHKELDDLMKKTLFRQTKNYIMSDKNLFGPIEVRPEKFINIKYLDIEKFYQIVGKIGEGSYGNVMKAMCLRTKQYRAIKILKKSRQQRKDKRDPQKSLQQLNILRLLDHPNIIKLYEVYFHNQCYYLVTQYCQGGSILQYLRQNRGYCQKIVKTIVKQLLSALVYLHSLRIAHRDIKLQNIVFIKKINSASNTEDVQIKIIDFGESFELKFSHNNKDSREIGTLTYMAPQVLQGLYSQKCDIWSCGVILWILLCGRHPFKRSSKRQTLISIKQQEMDFSDNFWINVPQNIKDLLKRMLVRNPLKRITARQALKNPWFTEQTQTMNTQLMKQVVQKLYHYYRGNNLVSVIQSYLTFLKITIEQKIQVTKLFKKLDKDNSGSIDISQLREAFTLCTGQEHNDQIQYVLKKIDKNKSKKIDLNQFITALYGRKKLFHQSSLELAFDYFDSDQSGFIDKRELRAVLKGCNQQEVNQILKDIDENGDQKISKEQFIAYIKNEKFL